VEGVYVEGGEGCQGRSEVRVYVIRGVAERRMTVLSDIDILIVAKEIPQR